jgi:hypothetical protein
MMHGIVISDDARKYHCLCKAPNRHDPTNILPCLIWSSRGQCPLDNEVCQLNHQQDAHHDTLECLFNRSNKPPSSLSAIFYSSCMHRLPPTVDNTFSSVRRPAPVTDHLPSGNGMECARYLARKMCNQWKPGLDARRARPNLAIDI